VSIFFRRPMPLSYLLSPLGQVSSDSSIGPHDPDDLWPRSPGLEHLQSLMPKCGSQATEPHSPGGGDPQSHPTPASPLVSDCLRPPPFLTCHRSIDQPNLASLTPRSPPSPLTGPPALRRVRFASVDGMRRQRHSLPVTAWEQDEQSNMSVRPPMPTQFRFRLCGSAVNLRRSRPAANKTDAQTRST
jgi:hypothetical protein